ncbi:class I SAM-dependent methyltransferase [Actinocorallia sp. A-T 12471]|uniref:class I SAM-dependent methyltransferase n=1 Tax=Actinocorallia sp. A-T 12471 TaxID=3089813 RepID=UPI0029D3C843|nr:methyltransferase domain-containing protein [Actinocorallia sp. A-T 12471]MDX6738402.1 methyltransferase [Actinocorallia sp. A-T 12471]
MSEKNQPVQPAAGEGALENHLGGDEARNYRKYEYDMVAPHVGRSLLEIGSGLGHFSEQFAGRLDYLAVSDNDPYCVEQLGKRYAQDRDVEVLSLALPAKVELRQKVDTVVMMNVLEHIAEDVQALKDLAAVVEPGGRIVIWVPGYMQLYGDFDRKVGHVTRYTPKTLGRTIAGAGLEAEVLKPINFLGGIAWWAAVRRGGVGYPDPRLVKIYDRTVIPTTRFIEKLVRPPFGQTVFAVARVPG